MQAGLRDITGTEVDETSFGRATDRIELSKAKLEAGSKSIEQLKDAIAEFDVTLKDGGLTQRNREKLTLKKAAYMDVLEIKEEKLKEIKREAKKHPRKRAAAGDETPAASSSSSAASAPLFDELPGPSSHLLEVLMQTFATRPYEQLPSVNKVLYALMWNLSSRERILFLEWYQRTHASAQQTAEEHSADMGVLGLWFVELFQRAYRQPLPPNFVEFKFLYFSPSRLGARGQLLLMRLIERYFDGAGGHSGGISGPLVLAGPRWPDIQSVVRGIAIAFSARAADPILYIDQVVNDVNVQFPMRTDVIQVVILNGRMKAALGDWLAQITRTTVQIPRTAASASMAADPAAIAAEAPTVAEQRRVVAEIDAYRAELSALVALIRAQRIGTAGAMSERDFDRFQRDISDIDREFVGLYGGKTQFLAYMRRQLAGKTTRPPNANHLIVTGEPGTGKTTIMRMVVPLLIKLQLIYPPTLASYRSVATAIQPYLTAEESDQVVNHTLRTVPAELQQHLDPSDLYALQVNDLWGPSSPYARPDILKPSTFSSAFTGGQVGAFNRQLLRTLGSMMIIDEAYDLAAAEFKQLVNALVSAITEYRLEWGSALVGYPAEMHAFIEQANVGLSSRYSSRVEFLPYSAAEMCTIFMRAILNSEDTTIGADVAQITRESRRNEDEIKSSDYFALFDQFYAQMWPYMRRDNPLVRDNLVGNGNARAVENMVTDAQTTARTELAVAPGDAAQESPALDEEAEMMMMITTTTPPPSSSSSDVAPSGRGLTFFISPERVRVMLAARRASGKPYARMGAPIGSDPGTRLMQS